MSERAKRIIPCLDTKDGRVVKGINFVDLKDIGDPVEIGKRYEAEGADELVFLDITATNEGRETRRGLVKNAAGTLKVPFAIGGGVRNIEDMRELMQLGAGKASVNTAAVKNPGLIAEAAKEFGKGRIVVAIDGKKAGERFAVVIKGGQEDAGLDLIEWAKECERLGAGEILLTSMDCDGVQGGYDIPMTKAVTEAVGIPVIASGGCGSIADIIEVFKETGCDAALCASLFHYGKATIKDVKDEMERNGIPCRRG
jgi:cyclase